MLSVAAWTPVEWEITMPLRNCVVAAIIVLAVAIVILVSLPDINWIAIAAP